MPSALQTHAEAVARDLSPEEPQEGEFGIDPITIITLIIGIIATLIQNCPLPQAGIRSALRRPSVLQRAALWKHVKSNCDCCNMGKYTFKLHRAMLTRASLLTDADAAAIVSEASDDQNLLV